MDRKLNLLQNLLCNTNGVNTCAYPPQKIRDVHEDYQAYVSCVVASQINPVEQQRQNQTVSAPVYTLPAVQEALLAEPRELVVASANDLFTGEIYKKNKQQAFYM